MKLVINTYQEHIIESMKRGKIITNHDPRTQKIVIGIKVDGITMPIALLDEIEVVESVHTLDHWVARATEDFFIANLEHHDG